MNMLHICNVGSRVCKSQSESFDSSMGVLDAVVLRLGHIHEAQLLHLLEDTHRNERCQTLAVRGTFV